MATTEEDWCWDLNPGVAAIEKETMWFRRRREACSFEGEEGGPCGFGGEARGPCGFGVLLFATRLRQQERLCREGKGKKDSCWWAVRRCHLALD